MNLVEAAGKAPHLVILGAGASIASSKRNPEKCGKVLPGMHNLIEVVGLQSILNKHGVPYNGEDFESLYSRLWSKGGHDSLLDKVERVVSRYFDRLRLPNKTTIYDYLVLSLCKKDMIATFNWDPFLAEAFVRNGEAVGWENLPNIKFLHGNVRVGICEDCKTCGWSMNSCRQCGKPFAPSKLMYPVANKDYSQDPFIANEWNAVRKCIQKAYLFTVFGYSAPETDREAKELLHYGWTSNPLLEYAEVALIDIKSENEVMSNWGDFPYSHHYHTHASLFDSFLLKHPRRSCEAFAEQTLEAQFIADERFPDHLLREHTPLIDVQNYIQKHY